MVQYGKGELVVRSRLRELITEKEIERGERIKQKEIADMTQLSKNTISRWMSPKPFDRIEADAATRLCRFLDVQLGELVVIEEVPSAQ